MNWARETAFRSISRKHQADGYPEIAGLDIDILCIGKVIVDAQLLDIGST
jgi:hypothetical protein